MPEVKAIIQAILGKECPSFLPQVTKPQQSDLDQIAALLREGNRSNDTVTLLKILQSDCLAILKPKQLLKPLLQISFAGLSSDVLIQAKLKISEGIIQVQDIYRTTTIDRYLQELSNTQNLTNLHAVRIEIINAGNNFLKQNFSLAAMQYLSAARMQAYVRDQEKKMQLIDKSIAFAFIAPINPQTHKVICALCLNQFAKRSKLSNLINKLYRQDIISVDQIKSIEPLLPAILKQKGGDGLSKLQQAAFSHNMIPIINSFSTIRLKTLLDLIGLKDIDELLVLLQKTYRNGEIKIDQLQGIVEINSTINVSETMKEFLTQIDSLIGE